MVVVVGHVKIETPVISSVEVSKRSKKTMFEPSVCLEISRSTFTTFPAPRINPFLLSTFFHFQDSL